MGWPSPFHSDETQTEGNEEIWPPPEPEQHLSPLGCITLGSFTPGLTQCPCKMCRESPGLGRGGEQAGGAHTGLLAAPLQHGKYRDMAVIGAGNQLDCGKLICELLKCNRRYFSVPRIEQGSINRK